MFTNSLCIGGCTCDSPCGGKELSGTLSQWQLSYTLSSPARRLKHWIASQYCGPFDALESLTVDLFLWQMNVLLFYWLERTTCGTRHVSLFWFICMSLLFVFFCRMSLRCMCRLAFGFWPLVVLISRAVTVNHFWLLWHVVLWYVLPGALWLVFENIP